MKKMPTPELLSTNHSSPAGQSSCELQTLRWCGPGADGRCICKRGRRRPWGAGTARRRSWGAAACCCATCCCRECGAARAPPAAWRTAAGRFVASPAGRPASPGPAPVMGGGAEVWSEVDGCLQTSGTDQLGGYQHFASWYIKNV